jgi:hypothetical protein
MSFFSIKPLPALAKSVKKSRTLFIRGQWGEEGGGGQRMIGSGPAYQSTAEFPVKTGFLKLAPHTCSFIFYLDNELQKLNCCEL